MFGTLRAVVEYYSNHAGLEDNNTLPGAQFNQAGLLMNVNQFWPQGYGPQNLAQDFFQFKRVVKAMKGKYQEYLAEITFSEAGHPSALVSSRDYPRVPCFRGEQVRPIPVVSSVPDDTSPCMHDGQNRPSTRACPGAKRRGIDANSSTSRSVPSSGSDAERVHHGLPERPPILLAVPPIWNDHVTSRYEFCTPGSRLDAKDFIRGVYCYQQSPPLSPASLSDRHLE